MEIAAGLLAHFFYEILSGNGKGIQFVLGVRNKIRTARKYFADRAYIAGYMLDAVQDHVFIVTENNVAVLAHKLHDQNLVAYISKFIEMLQFKFYHTFQSGLPDFCDSCASDVLAKKHAEVGGSERDSDPVFGSEINQRERSAGRQKQTLLAKGSLSCDEKFVRLPAERSC